MDLNKVVEDACIEVLKNRFAEVANVERFNEIISERLDEVEPALIKKLEQGLSEVREDYAKGIGVLSRDVTRFQDLTRTSVREALDNFEKKLNSLPQREIVVKYKPITETDPPLPDKHVGIQHEKFELLCSIINSGLNVILQGETGSGKSEGALRAARDVYRLDTYIITLNPFIPTSTIMGYMDGSGRYVPGCAYEPYKNGGVLIVEEMDNGSPGSNVAFNGLTGSTCWFPCGMLERHEKFRIIGTMNTIGNGANRKYVGRSPQDKALMNRFLFLEWGYDLTFEVRLAEVEYATYGGTDKSTLYKKIKDFRKIRKACESLGTEHILSPRNLLQAVRLHALGFTDEQISRLVIFRGIEPDLGRRIVVEANKIDLGSDEGGITFFEEEKPTSKEIEVVSQQNPIKVRSPWA